MLTLGWGVWLCKCTKIGKELMSLANELTTDVGECNGVQYKFQCSNDSSIFFHYHKYLHGVTKAHYFTLIEFVGSRYYIEYSNIIFTFI